MLSGIIVRKRSKESETVEEVKKAKTQEKSADVIVSTAFEENVLPEKPKTLSTNGLGALAGLGNYSSGSDNEDEAA